VTTTRLITLDDAEPLAALLNANRRFLGRWQPVRPDTPYTAENQRSAIAELLRQHVQGTVLPHVILDGSAGEERIVGRITLSDIVRYAFRSCHLGYWVAEADNRRGHATAAVGVIARVAFSELELHRLQAGVLPANGGSQRVLERNGFERIGLARAYLAINGRWEDHVLFQRINAASG
jgi:ribosomal-protein-alanine N-acetyltransferase